jgi:hypothetical protein
MFKPEIIKQPEGNERVTVLKKIHSHIVENALLHVPNEIFDLERVGLNKSQIAIEVLKIGLSDAVNILMDEKQVDQELHWPLHIMKCYLKLFKIIPEGEIQIHNIGKHLVKSIAPIALAQGTESVPFWYKKIGMLQEAECSEVKLMRMNGDTSSDRYKELLSRLEHRGVNNVDNLASLNPDMTLKEAKDYFKANPLENIESIKERLKKEIEAEINRL